jgi:signal transduction histidine kinase/ActR/RegA family two-component response regulator
MSAAVWARGAAADVGSLLPAAMKGERHAKRSAEPGASASGGRLRPRVGWEAARVGYWDLDLSTGRSRRTLRHDQCFGYSRPVPHWGFEVFLRHVHPHDRDTVRRLFLDAMRQRRDFQLECGIVWPDGSVHRIETHGSPLVEEGHIVGFVSEVTPPDVAEQDVREESLRKDEFIAVLAHELRNPLASTRNLLHLMRHSTEPLSHARAQATMERQLSQMVRLVDDLLDVNRIVKGKVELRRDCIDVAAVIGNAIEINRAHIEQAGHELMLRLPRQAILVHADEGRLTQVLANLLDNAVKYTPKAGRITVSAGLNGDHVEVSVSDTGIGIAAEMLRPVFGMFTQIDCSTETAKGGLGIGLALAKHLVGLHGGTLEAHSDGAGAGSTFVMRLPSLSDVSDAAPAARPASDPMTMSGTGKRVLVADDNRDCATSLATCLELMGHDVAIAYGGEEALDAASQCMPQAMLLDLSMPGVGGLEVARRIRQQPWGEQVLLIALTGWGRESDRSRSKEAGFDLHLVKPVDLKLLETALSSNVRNAH